MEIIFRSEHKFEKLIVWQKAIILSNDINVMTRSWPKKKLYSLISQINRASDSVSLNIAEGRTGMSTPEFKRFLGYSWRSAIEVINCLYLAVVRDLINKSEFDEKYKTVTELIKMIFGLKNSLK